MGRLFAHRNLTASFMLQLSQPIILCTDRHDFRTALKNEGYQTISLNLPIAKSLIRLNINEIKLILPERFLDLLAANKKNYLVDYEMLFDPRYEIDVLSLFCKAALSCKLIVKWCGRLEGDTLLFSEQGYIDYKRFQISQYNISVVV